MSIRKVLVLGSFFSVLACLPLRAPPNLFGEPEDITIRAGGRAFIVTSAFVSTMNPDNSVYLGVHPDTSTRLGDAINNAAGEVTFHTNPLFETTQVWMRLCDLTGCVDTRTVTITVLSDEPTGPPAPFEDAEELGDDWFRSAWWGDFNIAFFPWIFHAQHSWMFVFDGSMADSVFLFDLVSEAWFWTNATSYPNLFSFGRNSWVFYFQDTSAPRQFVDLQSGEFFGLD